MLRQLQAVLALRGSTGPRRDLACVFSHGVARLHPAGPSWNWGGSWELRVRDGSRHAFANPTGRSWALPDNMRIRQDQKLGFYCYTGEFSRKWISLKSYSGEKKTQFTWHVNMCVCEYIDMDPIFSIVKWRNFCKYNLYVILNWVLPNLKWCNFYKIALFFKIIFIISWYKLSTRVSWRVCLLYLLSKT